MTLEEQITALRDRIEAIRAEGAIASDNTWINEFQAGSKRKDGYKYYTYYKLMEAIGKKSKTGKIQGRQIAYLGKAVSRKYQEAKGAIDRRNEIQRLESEIQRLEALLE
jgi:hypothetical protein